MEQTTNSKYHIEVNYSAFQLLSIDRLAAPLIIAVALHVNPTLEVVIFEGDLYEDSVSKTVDLEFWPVDICWDWW